MSHYVGQRPQHIFPEREAEAQEDEEEPIGQAEWRLGSWAGVLHLKVWSAHSTAHTLLPFTGVPEQPRPLVLIPMA